MTDLSSIRDKTLVDHRVMIQILAVLKPSPLTKESTLFDIGYERCKQDVLEILASGISPELKVHPCDRIIRELRRK